MEKTQKIVNIPLSKFARQILEKYKDETSPLPIISNQKCNDYIKECLGIIADKQGHLDNGLFNRKIRHRNVSGKKVVQIISPLKDGITFHVGRKTFITNSLMLGINLQVLQSMGAPIKQDHLKKYLDIVDAFKSQEMQNTWDKVVL
jgi:integrase